MKRTVEKIVGYAVRIAEPDLVILFGSMAENRNNVHSDVDLLIVSENPELKKEIKARINNFTNQLSLKVDVLVHSQSELNQAYQTPHSFLEAIVKSGKIVYQKDCEFGENPVKYQLSE